MPLPDEEFAAEAGVFIHFEHVDAGVGNAALDEGVEGTLPGVGGLVRQAGDEVDADARDAGCLHAADVFEGDCAGVETAGDGGFAVVEGLDAEAGAIHADLEHGVEEGVRDLAGGTFHGDFGIVVDLEFISQCGEQAEEQVGRQGAGRSATEVDGVDAVGEWDSLRCEGVAGGADVLEKALRYSAPGSSRERRRTRSCSRCTSTGRTGPRCRGRGGPWWSAYIFPCPGDAVDERGLAG